MSEPTPRPPETPRAEHLVAGSAAHSGARRVEPDRSPTRLDRQDEQSRQDGQDRHPLRESLADLGEFVPPRLRGWLHAGAFPLVILGGLTLVTLTPGLRARTGAAVFVAAAALLFGISALYHRGRWSPPVKRLLGRLDHANIFIAIAGTYTAFALSLLPEGQARTLLWTIWIGAAAGVFLRVVWLGAPRWLTTAIYVALGWVAVFYLGPLYAGGGPVIVALIAAGGVLYTVGALVYGLKRPDPSPRWFGFHEVFHAFTIAAFGTHAVAVAMALASPSAA
ncbi:PAQR family membrane homeostasis protein TrhA [Mobilicoccus massiliensis]|uniref:PAQR family membrane homeostasis protein TrhA n=1 Tax=Mobilicoccus massiliensis TaxID=1522310 RepID=UPI0009E42FA8|nr:hemolysin III family protein [Mobilicoccus massiliensis]